MLKTSVVPNLNLDLTALLDLLTGDDDLKYDDDDMID